MKFEITNMIDKLGIKYEKFNPNPNEDKSLDHNDCTLRAIIAAFPEYTWENVFDMLCRIARDMHVMPDSLEPFIALLTILSDGKDTSIYHKESDDEEIAVFDVITREEIQTGTVVIITEKHAFTMVDGTIYDMYSKEEFDQYLLHEVNIVWRLK